MSNNKQSSVEFLAEMVSKMGYVSLEILEQAKAMHKEEIDEVTKKKYIAEVAMWLYEKNGIWVVVSYELNIENHKKEWFWIAIKDGEEIAYQYKNFNSPTEAYEDAITYYLEN